MDWGLAEQYARECLADYGIKPTGIRIEVLAEAYMRSRGEDPRYALAAIEADPVGTMDDPRKPERIRRIARELQELLAYQW